MSQAPAYISAISYNGGSKEVIEEKVEPQNLSQYVDKQREAGRLMWLNVEGFHPEVIGRTTHLFGIHELVMEDIRQTNHRAKVEAYENYYLLITRIATMHKGVLAQEQVSIVFGYDFVITFQEGLQGDVYGTVRNRLLAGEKFFSEGHGGHLAYALLDGSIDSYYPVLEAYGEKVEDLEDILLEKPDPENMLQIQQIKKEMMKLRRSLWPHREMVMRLMRRDEMEIFDDQLDVYLRDAYDHVIELIDLVENYREVTSGLVDLYLSSQSNQMNEVMKVLTIIATVFIPLSFISGVYGMNFNTKDKYNMPELSWAYGYPFALGLMLLVAGGLTLYFWRKGWITIFGHKAPGNG